MASYPEVSTNYVTRDNYQRLKGDKEIVAQACVYNIMSKLDPASNIQVKFARALRKKILEPWTKFKQGTPVHTKDKKVNSFARALIEVLCD